jgi:pyruvate/2-oxoglutarate dehydrogenase complex dihydrolipoamide acyltransferase (E2) component
MFTVWQVSTFGTMMLYGLIYDWRVLAIWLSIIIVYIVLGAVQGDFRTNKIRAKIRMATWDPPTDPNCYVKVEINLKTADAYIKKKEKEGVRITYTGLALKSIGNAFSSPQAKNYHGKIVFGRFVPIDDVDVFTLVDVEGGKDLAGLTVKRCDKQGIKELMEQMAGKVSKIKSAKDKDIKNQTSAANFLPVFLVQTLTQVVSFITYNLSMPIKLLNFKKNHFGTILLTNVSGMPGFHEAYGPISNFTRTMATIVMCTPQDRPIVEDGQIVVAKMMNVMITFDHRYLDGKIASTMFSSITDVWNNPDKYE